MLMCIVKNLGKMVLLFQDKALLRQSLARRVLGRGQTAAHFVSHLMSGVFGKLVLAGLIIVCAVFLGRVFWSTAELVQPSGHLSQISASSPARSTGYQVVEFPVLLTSNPFARFEPTQSLAVPGNAPDTALNIKLLGLRADLVNAEKGGAIVVKPDGEQSLVREGDEVIEGVFVASILENQIIINREGISERILLDSLSNTGFRTVVREKRPFRGLILDQNMSSSATAQVETVLANRDNDRRDFIRHVSLNPVKQKDGSVGYRIGTASNMRRFFELGFKQGDVLVRVNGQQIAALGLIQIYQLFEGDGAVDVTLDRDGTVLNLTV